MPPCPAAPQPRWTPVTTLCAHRKREERLRKVLQARERVEQMKEEKKKQIEQKFSKSTREDGEGAGLGFVVAAPVDWTHGDAPPVSCPISFSCPSWAPQF